MQANRSELSGPSPMADKDNIDLAGVPTMAACPAYARLPNHSPTVLQRLLTARAIAIGKTNLDQFVTGLVGVHSPYGIPRDPFDPAYIPGGSSLGSAAAVLSVAERLVAIETFLHESGDARHRRLIVSTPWKPSRCA